MKTPGSNRRITTAATFWERRGVVRVPLTGSDNLFNLHKGDVDFLGELSHGLVGVLVGEGVDVHLDPCGEGEAGALRGKKGKEEI